ncbi:hypothetical protein [Aquimarina algiphila]|uniref:Uncharacterized protein n=1 Tax=Aquimarina algiphila TaxID=2047982 RepID=A0A554VA36_9FLAO|nr:hypothetical protein [Aquimarina algiphila]TSE02654.1 hypothetical protein FOF46_30680 [Aquimarina algiphila]
METLSINKTRKRKTTVKPYSKTSINSNTISKLLSAAIVEINQEDQTIFLEAFQINHNYNKGYVITIDTSPIDGEWDMAISFNGELIELTQFQKEQIENQIYNYAIAS